MSFKRFKTERFLLVSIAVLLLFLFVSVFSRETGIRTSSADEDSDASSPSSNESSNDEDSEDSEDNDGDSEDSTSEASEGEEDSESSVYSTSSVRRTQTTGGAEASEESTSEVSLQSAEETSEDSDLSQRSSEASEESIKYVEGYGEVVSREGNVAIVKKGKRLFYLIPVEVESRVTLGEQGEVLDEKKSFWNWLLSAFSA